MGLNLVEAAQAAGVRKIVYNGVYHPSLPLENHASTRLVEAGLYASAMDFTILQPAMYLQGLDGAFEQARRTGTLVMPWSKHSKMTYVDYRELPRPRRSRSRATGCPSARSSSPRRAWSTASGSPS